MNKIRSAVEGTRFGPLTLDAVQQRLWASSLNTPEMGWAMLFKEIKQWDDIGRYPINILRIDLKSRDLATAMGGTLYMQMLVNDPDRQKTPDDKVYRVELLPNGVDVICLGISKIDAAVEGYYDNVDALPEWVKERLAVLSILEFKPPTTEVRDIGRRINITTYWVYAPD